MERLITVLLVSLVSFWQINAAYGDNGVCYQCSFNSSNATDQNTFCKDPETEVDAEKAEGFTCEIEGDIKCLLYQIKAEDGNFITTRNCTIENTCESVNTKGELVMCDSCSGDKCNSNRTTAGYTIGCAVCDESSDKDCASKLDENKQYLDETINTACFIYEYINPENSAERFTVRGLKNNETDVCKTIEGKALTRCKTCKDSDMCNKEFGDEAETKYCVQCLGEDCNVDSYPDKIGDNYCALKDTEVCIMYKNTADKVVQTVRQCGEKNYCQEMFENFNSSLVMCNECTDQLCNQKLSEDTKCLQCSSSTDSACDSNDGKNVTTYCYRDDTVKPQCLVSKHITDNGTIVTERDCVNADVKCDQIDNSIYCNTGCTGKDCNAVIDSEKTFCISCDSDTEGASCDAGNVSLVSKNTCSLSTDQKCTTAQYYKGSTLKLSRGCFSKDYCSTNDAVVACSSCTDEICNNYEPEHLYNVCIKCSGGSCNSDEFTEDYPDSYCRVGDGEQCIVYRYEDSNSKENVTVRDCIAKNSTSCAILKQSKSSGVLINGTLSKCVECDGDLCNNNVGDDIISGASAIEVAVSMLLLFSFVRLMF